MNLMKLVALISGGIDSPVAIQMMLKQGVEIVPAYFDNSPFSDEFTDQRALDNLKRLKKLYPKHLKPARIIPHGPSLIEFAQKCDRRYTCVLCRRMMFRVAGKLAKKLKADGLVTGEALGQKASQTIENLNVTTQATDMPILRPLIGMDKEETIKIAKDIGTFDISTRKAICCQVVPQYPATRSTLERLESEEEKVDLNKLTEVALNGVKTQ